jgi:hypothetical protein
VTLTVSAKPTLIEIDPDDICLMELNFSPGVDLLTSSLTSSQSVVKRIWAGEELVKVSVISSGCTNRF